MPNPGIQSLGGFLYQLKVFVYSVFNNINTCEIVYEGIDDVECKTDEEKLFMHVIPDYANRKAIQVKNGIITKELISKVIFSWLKLGKFNQISYILMYSNTYDFETKSEIVDYTVDSLVKFNLSKKKKRSDCLYSIISKQYKEHNGSLNLGKLRADIEPIVDSLLENKQQFTGAEIDKIIFEIYSKIYCKDLSAQIAKEKRLELLLHKIYRKLCDAVGEGQSYSLQYSEFIRMNNEVVAQVKDEFYQPDWTVFKKRNSTQEQIQRIFSANPREVRELSSIGLHTPDILKYLMCEIFYKDIRDVYIVTRQAQIDGLEDTAHEIFCDQKSNFPGDRMGLFKSVVLSDNYLRYNDISLNKFSHEGCYVYLSGDSANDEVRISWSDNDD